MDSELERLIDMVVADGKITEKERAVVLKKVTELGADIDEVEIYLNAKLHQINQVNKQVVFPVPPLEKKSNKEGDIKKCPSCGAPVESFNTKCADCDHEFRNIQAVSSISKLYEDLKRAEEEERLRPKSWVEKLDGELSINKSVANKQKSIIATFPVPNTKEDLLEFLSLASSEAQKKTGFSLYKNIDPVHVLKNAWHAKCEQIIIKARFSMKEDKKVLAEIEGYAKRLKIK